MHAVTQGILLGLINQILADNKTGMLKVALAACDDHDKEGQATKICTNLRWRNWFALLRSVRKFVFMTAVFRHHDNEEQGKVPLPRWPVLATTIPDI